ncbi:hypothetical protein ACJX0J_010318, partial [Zea mays]
CSGERAQEENVLVRVLSIVSEAQSICSDYCMTVEGDECCSCWDAYFELNKLE